MVTKVGESNCITLHYTIVDHFVLTAQHVVFYYQFWFIPAFLVHLWRSVPSLFMDEISFRRISDPYDELKTLLSIRDFQLQSERGKKQTERPQACNPIHHLYMNLTKAQSVQRDCAVTVACDWLNRGRCRSSPCLWVTAACVQNHLSAWHCLVY